MAKHTPMPWMIDMGEGDYPLVFSYDGRLIADPLVNDEAAVKDPVEVMANCTAIAAAPEMLETLEWILDGGWNDGPGSWATLDRRLEEVIAKARGETP